MQETMLAQHELEQPENLYDAMQNEVVTMFGLTDTFSNLVKLCPHDLSQVSPERKHELAAKALETAAEPAREKYAHLRAEPKAKSEKVEKTEEIAQTAKSVEASNLSPVFTKAKIETATQAMESGLPAPVQGEQSEHNDMTSATAIETTPNDGTTTSNSTAESTESAAPQQAGGGPSDQELEGKTLEQSSISYEAPTLPKRELKVATFIKRVSQTIKLKLELTAPEAQPESLAPAISTENIAPTEIQTENMADEVVVGVPEPLLAGLYQVESAALDSEEVTGDDLFYEEQNAAENAADVYVEPVFTGTEPVTDDQFMELMKAAFPDEASKPIFDFTINNEQSEQAREPNVMRALPPVMKATLLELASEDTLEAELLVESTEKMSLVAERLQELCTTGQEDSTEASQIEQVLIEYYEQLCAIAHHEVDPTEQEAFITALKANDDGTHEDKQGIFHQPLQPVQDARMVRLVRFILQTRTFHSS